MHHPAEVLEPPLDEGQDLKCCRMLCKTGGSSMPQLGLLTMLSLREGIPFAISDFFFCSVVEWGTGSNADSNLFYVYFQISTCSFKLLRKRIFAFLPYFTQRKEILGCFVPDCQDVK